MSENGKPTVGERDKQSRNKKQGNGRRRGRGRNSRWSAEAYKQRIDEKLFGKKGDAARNRLEERLRAAHGSPNFLRTYKEYLRGYGMPEDVRLLLLLLDLSDESEVLKVLNVLDDTVKSAPQGQRSLVKSRLRNLEISTPSDSLADAATDLLGRL